MNLRCKLLHEDARLPERATDGALGFDLRTTHNVVLPAGGVAAAGTGVAVEPPEGFGLMLLIRSGLARKRQIGLVNGVGLIDEDYRGELIFALQNFSDEVLWINAGERIGQVALMQNFARGVQPIESELSHTARGTGGFGSTGYGGSEK